MPSPSPSEAAVLLREAIAALSARLAGDYGDLVPDASAERTTALLAAVGAAGADGRGVTERDLRTLDSWIRLADSAVLHDDPAEARARTQLARQLRAVRALVAPSTGTLSEDPRTG